MQGPLCDQWWWLSSVPVVVHGVCTWMDRHTREMKRRWCWMVEWKVKQTRTIVERQRSATEEESTFFVMRDFWRAKLEIFWLAGRQATYSKSVSSAPLHERDVVVQCFIIKEGQSVSIFSDIVIPWRSRLESERSINWPQKPPPTFCPYRDFWILPFRPIAGLKSCNCG